MSEELFDFYDMIVNISLKLGINTEQTLQLIQVYELKEINRNLGNLEYALGELR